VPSGANAMLSKKCPVLPTRLATPVDLSIV